MSAVVVVVVVAAAAVAVAAAAIIIECSTLAIDGTTWNGGSAGR